MSEQKKDIDYYKIFSKKKQLAALDGLDIIKMLYNLVFSVLHDKSDASLIFGSMSFYLNNSTELTEKYFDVLPDIDIYATHNVFKEMLVRLRRINKVYKDLKLVVKKTEIYGKSDTLQFYVNSYHLIDMILISEYKISEMISTSCSELKIHSGNSFFEHENFFTENYNVNIMKNEQLLNYFIYSLSSPDRVKNMLIERIKFLWKKEKTNTLDKFSDVDCSYLPELDADLEEILNNLITSHKDDLLFGIPVNDALVDKTPRILICNKRDVYDLVINQFVINDNKIETYEINDQLLKIFSSINDQIFVIFFNKCMQYSVIGDIKIASPILLSSIILMLTNINQFKLTEYLKCMIINNYSSITDDNVLFLDTIDGEVNHYNILGTMCIKQLSDTTITDSGEISYSGDNVILDKRTKSIEKIWGLGIENEIMFYSELYGASYDFSDYYVHKYKDLENIEKYGKPRSRENNFGRSDYYKYFKLVNYYAFLAANARTIGSYAIDDSSLLKYLEKDIDKEKIVNELSNTSATNCRTHSRARLLDPTGGDYCNLEIVTRDNKNKTIDDVISELVTTREKILALLKKLSTDAIHITDHASYPYALVTRKSVSGDTTQVVYEKMASYHFNITLPFFADESIERKDQVHKNFAKVLQLFEPYLASMFGTPDYNAVDPSNQKMWLSLASYRLFNTIYAFVGTVNLMTNEQIPDSRIVSSQTICDGFKQFMNRIPYYDFIGALYQGSLGTDIRKTQRDSGYFGIEIRFFDNFSPNYLYDCLSFIFYLADISNELYEGFDQTLNDCANKLDNFLSSPAYFESLYKIIRCGSLYKPDININPSGFYVSEITSIDTLIYSIMHRLVATKCPDELENFQRKINVYNKGSIYSLHEFMVTYFEYMKLIFGTSGHFSSYLVTKLSDNDFPCPNKEHILDACYSSSHILYKYLLHTGEMQYPFNIIKHDLLIDIDKYAFREIIGFDNSYYVGDTYYNIESFVVHRNSTRNINFLKYNKINTPCYLPYNLIIIPVDLSADENLSLKYPQSSILTNSLITKRLKRSGYDAIKNVGIIIYASMNSFILCEKEDKTIVKYKHVSLTDDSY